MRDDQTTDGVTLVLILAGLGLVVAVVVGLAKPTEVGLRQEHFLSAETTASGFFASPLVAEPQIRVNELPQVD